MPWRIAPTSEEECEIRAIDFRVEIGVAGGGVALVRAETSDALMSHSEAPSIDSHFYSSSLQKLKKFQHYCALEGFDWLLCQCFEQLLCFSRLTIVY